MAPRQPNTTNSPSEEDNETLTLSGDGAVESHDEESNNKPSKYKWYRIDPNAIPSKCAYFFESARRISYEPNMVMFLTSIGLNKAEAGLIFGLRYVFVCDYFFLI